MPVLDKMNSGKLAFSVRMFIWLEVRLGLLFTVAVSEVKFPLISLCLSPLLALDFSREFFLNKV